MNVQANGRPTLYVVATPIGNLADMVPRAVEILHAADFIAAEDTRHSAKLLAHFDIRTPLIAYHDHSGESKVQLLVEHLLAGKTVALVSDAGTPLISDPGYRLVTTAREHGVTVSPVPGACAMIAALSASGLPSDRFVFEGFPPARSAARVQWLARLENESRTLIFYESTHRILASIEDMAQVFGGDRQAVIAREITKAFESFLQGSLADLLLTLRTETRHQKGEFVVLVAGLPEQQSTRSEESAGRQAVEMLMAEGLGVKQSAHLAAKLTGAKKNALYQYALEIQSS